MKKEITGFCKLLTEQVLSEQEVIRKWRKGNAKRDLQSPVASTPVALQQTIVTSEPGQSEMTLSTALERIEREVRCGVRSKDKVQTHASAKTSAMSKTMERIRRELGMKL